MSGKLDGVREKINSYFTEKLEQFGTTAKGVDYNGDAAQQIRFAELVKIVKNPPARFSLIDYGCGYGALFDYLQAYNWLFDYYGVDLIEKMVLAGRESH